MGKSTNRRLEQQYCTVVHIVHMLSESGTRREKIARGASRTAFRRDRITAAYVRCLNVCEYPSIDVHPLYTTRRTK